MMQLKMFEVFKCSKCFKCSTMATGTCSVSALKVTDVAQRITQIQDTALGAETHENVLAFDDSGADGAHGDGFVNKTLALNDLDQVVPAVVPPHDTLLTFNDVSVDTGFASGWVGKSVTDILENFQVTVEGLVLIELNKIKGRSGNTAMTDCVAFTDTVDNGNTMGIGSCGDNNVVMKREPTDSDFVFLAVLGRGEILNLALPSGTIFRSSKGITGFSSPFPMPFGISSLSDVYFRLFAFRFDVSIYATSAGLESVVTLYASDETTIVDGPYTIAPYETTTLTCNANAEFVVVATKGVYLGSLGYNPNNGLDIDLRLIPPMTNEVITWNRNCRVTAQEANTVVRWYRRNGETGSFTMNAGTPVAIYTGTINEDAGATNNNAGNDNNYSEDGCVILRGDKPISAFAGADGSGWESTPGWPLDQLAQLFANPSTINGNVNARVASVTIGSPYEGTASVYDSGQDLVTTFSITRGVAVSSPDDQLYPASGQWQPIDSGLSNYTGGYIETNVPSICIMNFQGSSQWSDSGDELMVPGVSPEDTRATLRKHPSGIWRRRDLDGVGVETWNVC